MKKVLVIMSMLFAFSTSAFGYATIYTAYRGSDSITFDSNVSDVEIYHNNKPIGFIKGGSFVYKLKRDGEAKSFTFKKAGYKDVTVVANTNLDTVFWFNVLGAGGAPFFSSTDSFFTKNAYEYSPNQFYVEMQKG